MTLLILVLAIAASAPAIIFYAVPRPWSVAGVVVAGAPVFAFAGLVAPDFQRIFEGLRDILIVIAVVACVLNCKHLIERPKIRVASALYALLMFLVMISLFAPTLPNLTVGAIGARAWLLYPLMIIPGYYLVYKNKLLNVLRLTLWIGLPVVLIGIIDAGLGAVGSPSVLVSLHLDSQSVAAQLAAGFDVGQGRLTRVSSVFPFALAHFVFTAFYTAAAVYCSRAQPGRSQLYLALAGLGAIACLSSGTRLALVVVPCLIIFGGQTLSARKLLPSVAIAVLGGVAFTQITNIKLRDVPTYLLDLGIREFEDVIINGMSVALDVTTWGRGAGTDTNAAREAVSGDLFAAIGGRWQESLLAKSWIELGFVGFVLVCLVFTVLTLTLVRARRVSHEFAPLAVVALLLALISLKGTLLEQAPAGLLVWMLVGVCLAVIDGDAEGGRRLVTRSDSHSRV